MRIRTAFLLFLCASCETATIPMTAAAESAYSATTPSSKGTDTTELRSLRPIQNDVDVIMSRVSSPSQKSVSIYLESGMKGLTEHHLSPSEIREVRAAISSLPQFFREMLALHLRHLSFVDGVPGVGSGLTVAIGPSRSVSDITIRASVFGESLTDFFTHKEQRCFQPDGSNIKVLFKGGRVDALTLILLHEATHVIDYAVGITDVKGSPYLHNAFFKGVWQNTRELSAPYADSIISRNVFREVDGGPRIKIAEAPQVYRLLAKSPFVDLFATSSEQEDLSSLVSFYVLWKNFHVSPEIDVSDRSGRTVSRYHPVTFPKVRARYNAVEMLLGIRTS